MRWLAVVVGVLSGLALATPAVAAPSFSSWDLRPDSEPQAISAGSGSPYVWVAEHHPYSAVAYVNPDAAPPNGLTEIEDAPGDEPFGTVNAYLTGVAAGPDGNAWFSQQVEGKVGRVAPNGAYATFATADVTDMTVGGDGAIWGMKRESQKIARIPTDVTQASQITEYDAGGFPIGLTTGPDGALYFSQGTSIARMATNGVITKTWPLPAGMEAREVVWGPDESGATNWIWFTDLVTGTDKVGRLDPVTGAVVEFGLPDGVKTLQDITAAPDGRIYATAMDSDQVIRVKPVLGAIVTDTYNTGDTPWGITLGPDQNVWFTQSQHAVGQRPRLWRIGIRPATAATDPATTVTTTSATLGATVNPHGSQTHVAFVYGTDPGLAGATTSPGTNLVADGLDHPTGETVSGLTNGTTYYYRVTADNGNGAETGTIRSFVPGSAQPNAPSNTALPVVSGTVQLAGTVSCATGTWTNSPTNFSYQWRRAGQPINGATTASYTLADDDSGKAVTCAVTAANGGGSATAVSNAVTPPVVAPENVGAPHFSTTELRVGEEATCNLGDWLHNPTSYKVQLTRDGVPFENRQGGAYHPTDVDAGHMLACDVTATNSAGSATAKGTPAIVTGRTPLNQRLPSVDGVYQVGKLLNCERGAWTTTPTAYRFQWLRDDAPLAGVTGQYYTPTRDDIGRTLSCQVVAENGPDAVSAPATSAGRRILPPPPSVLTRPTITGDIQVGGAVTCNPGTWLDDDGSVQYQWSRNGVVLADASNPRRTVVLEDAGQLLECRVTKHGEGGFSDATARVSVALIVRNMRVTGIEVTQAIQKEDCSGCIGTLPSRPASNISGKGTATYQGVRLAAGHWLVVRVFADYTNPSKVGGGPLKNVHATLQIAGDATHPAVTLSPDSTPASIPEAAAGALPQVTLDQRNDATASFNFLVPWQHTNRRYLSLRATIGGVQTDPLQPRQCTGCGANVFDLLNVGPFRQTANVPLHPYPIAINGVTTPKTLTDVFETATEMLPLNVSTLPNAPVIEISGILNDAKVTNKTSAIVAALAKRAGDDKLGKDQYPIGYFVDGTKGVGGSTVSDRILFGDKGPPISIARDDRPVDSVAHEIGHGLGFVHADSMPHPSGRADCGGDSVNSQKPTGDQVGEPWAPDNEGLIQGVGLDRTKWDIYKTGSLPRPFSDAKPTANDHYFDFMSYCSAGDTPHHWISVRNWERMIDFHPPAQTIRSADAAPRATADPVRVIATVGGDGSASIFDVAPGQSSTLPPTPGSAFAVQFVDASGRALTAVAPSASVIHTDGQHPGLLLQTTLPLSPDVAGVTVTNEGNVVARRDRSAHPPTAKVTVPRAGARVKGRTVVVRWTQADADSDRLTSTVDYSSDDGRTWRVVADGVTGTSAKVPARFFSASRKARVRVRVSDGFDVATAASGRFTAEGVPPTVRIVDGVKGGRVRADALVLLSGEAYDDADRPLTGKRLRWFAGKRLLGSGAQISVQGLPPGRTRIRLVATDTHGRSGEASFGLRVAGVRPVFLTTVIPPKVGRTARSITLKLSSVVPAKLKIGGHTYPLTRAPRKVVVAIKPGRTALRIAYTLSATRHVTRGAFTAAR